MNSPHTQSYEHYGQQHLHSHVTAALCKQVIWHDASRSQWQEYALEIGEILHIFPSGTQSMGDMGSKKADRGRL